MEISFVKIEAVPAY